MPAILALNAGSSSVKFAAFEAAGDVRLRGSLSGLDATQPQLKAQDAAGATLVDRPWRGQGIDPLLDWLIDHLRNDIAGIGHRIVHGGREFCRPVRIDADVLARMEALTPLAPLHQPVNLAPIRMLLSKLPDVPQVACFDTAFHHALAPPVSRYPLPRALEAEGIRRYGFHGLSYESIVAGLAAMDDGAADERVIVAHLGSGASLCALRDLRSVDTTMGFSAIDGLMMATRPGALDPGIVLYLLQEKGYDAAALRDLLYHRCGLAGVSGISSDVRVLQASERPEAAEALELFAFLAVRHAAGLIATLGGLDRFVFTGGIGEHSANVRASIAAGLAWLGARLDPDANAAHLGTISASGSRLRLQMLPTDEERVIARHVRGLLEA